MSVEAQSTQNGFPYIDLYLKLPQDCRGWITTSPMSTVVSLLIGNVNYM